MSDEERECTNCGACSPIQEAEERLSAIENSAREIVDLIGVDLIVARRTEPTREQQSTITSMLQTALFLKQQCLSFIGAMTMYWEMVADEEDDPEKQEDEDIPEPIKVEGNGSINEKVIYAKAHPGAV
jgi:hypothetical protein